MIELLKELLQRKIDELDAEYHQNINNNDDTLIKKLESDKGILEQILTDVDEHNDNFRHLSLKEILSLVDEYYEGEDFDQDELLNNLEKVRLVLVGKFDNGLPMELSINQKNWFQKFLKIINDVTEKINVQIEDKKSQRTTVEEMEKLEDDIIDLTTLLEKVSDETIEPLTQSEFELFYKAIIQDESIDFDSKKKALIDFRNYNLGLSKRKPVDIDEVKECFRGLANGPKICEYIDQYKDDVLANADTDNIKSIIDYLQNIVINSQNGERTVDLTRNFTPLNFLIISLYGTQQTVKLQLERMEKDNNYSNILFETPSLWTKASERRKHKKHRPGTVPPGPPMDPSLKNKAYEITYEEMLTNEKFLRSKGFDVSIKDGRGMKALKTIPERLRKNYEIYKKYGIIGEYVADFSVSALGFSAIEDSCDRLIEIGLLHGPEGLRDEWINYAKYYPSCINNLTTENLYLAAHLKQSSSDDTSYYDQIFSHNRRGCLSTDFTARNMNWPDKLLENLPNKFVDFTVCEDLPNFSLYEGVTSSSDDIGFSLSVLQNPEIRKLEENHRVAGNEYVYKFGNQYISRLKVLRNYSALQANDSLDSDALLYCVTKDSLLMPDTFEQIKSSVEQITKQGVK